jgi:hypothetical protein
MNPRPASRALTQDEKQPQVPRLVRQGGLTRDDSVLVSGGRRLVGGVSLRDGRLSLERS